MVLFPGIHLLFLMFTHYILTVQKQCIILIYLLENRPGVLLILPYIPSFDPWQGLPEAAEHHRTTPQRHTASGVLARAGLQHSANTRMWFTYLYPYSFSFLHVGIVNIQLSGLSLRGRAFCIIFFVNLKNNSSKPIRIVFVVVHRILTVLNTCEDFSERRFLS